MSGPVSTVDAPADQADTGHPAPPCLEVSDSREATVGAVRVRRALPLRGRRTVGAWCFADHMGRPTSPRTAAWTSARTPTSACRPSPG
ncbi:hypothetical protein ACR6C2_01150 [Streptomyces sp. INA 01156]